MYPALVNNMTTGETRLRRGSSKFPRESIEAEKSQNSDDHYASGRRILIAGAPTGCWTNAGDEAIFACMLRDLRAAIPSVVVRVASSNPAGMLAGYAVNEVPYNDIPRLIDAARESDLLILGGGSVFYDYWGFDPDALLTPRHSGLSFYAGFAMLAGLLGKPLMMYGIGVGPLTTGEGRSSARAAFELANAITVRDPDSLRALESFGIGAGQAIITADPAFGFTATDRDLACKMLRGMGCEMDERPLVGVALREWDVGVAPDVWERGIAAALDSFLESHGGRIVFIPFHKTVDWPLTDDKGVAERVATLMRHRDKTLAVSADLTPAEKAGILAQCDLALAMRAHAAIFALDAGVPTIALAYDPKVSGIMRLADCSRYCLELGEVKGEDLARLLSRAWAERKALRLHIEERAEALRLAARSTADVAAALLNGSPHAQKPLTAETRALLRDLESRLIERPEQMARSIKSASQSTLKPSPVKSSTERSELKRVAILTNRLVDWESSRPRFGGAENYCLRLGTLLRELGFDITFFQAGKSGLTDDYYGFKVIALPMGDHYSEFQHGVCNQFFEHTLDYDHVIYNMVNYASGQVREDALLICHGIWFDHSYYSPLFSFRSPEWFAHLYRAFSSPARVVSVDANSINVIRALWPELAEKMIYLPNWADITMFHPPPVRQTAPLTVLFPRRGERIRGSRLVESILKAIPHDCRFLWVGEGEAEDNEYLRGLERVDPRFSF
ncbi:MAG TPA: polysaccharide pyruvyl transferase family protein, partial [Blastocatellia bacterium]|nr:polysaccharide pyruvyl transferase family protein [Blastocatellia bacterium]